MWCVGAQVSREPPPPLPGGYVVGEQVYYTGASQALESGDWVEHGKQGEVVGPATSESTKSKGVAVLFPGNKGAIEIALHWVRHCRRRAAHHNSPPLQLPHTPHYTMARCECAG